MGVWIEIMSEDRKTVTLNLSLPVWECGLKLLSGNAQILARGHSLYGSVD